jgi:hypothetical protein
MKEHHFLEAGPFKLAAQLNNAPLHSVQVFRQLRSDLKVHAQSRRARENV